VRGARRIGRSARSTSASTPAPPNSPRPRPICIRPTSRPSPASRCRGQSLDRKKVVILGGGPNRIGQGIEFDYCCCHACFALRRRLRDHHGQLQPRDGLDRLRHLGPLYFEPLTAEDVLEILARRSERHAARRHRAVRRPDAAEARHARSRRRASRSSAPAPDSIDLAEDRDRFKRLLDKLELKQPKNGIAYSVEQARIVAEARPAAGRAPVLRARRPRHGRSSTTRRRSSYLLETLPRSCRSEVLNALPQRQDRPDQHGARQEPAAVRPLPRRRHRGRRRLPLRRQGRLRRRHHGAYRGGRHPFGRQRLLAAAALALPEIIAELKRQTTAWRSPSTSAA
jgi:hypothetical protein